MVTYPYEMGVYAHDGMTTDISPAIQAVMQLDQAFYKLHGVVKHPSPPAGKNDHESDYTLTGINRVITAISDITKSISDINKAAEAAWQAVTDLAQ